MAALALLGMLFLQDPDVDALLKQLEDESIVVRDKAAANLIALGEAAEKAINDRLTSAGGEYKARLQSVLRDIGKERRLRAVFPKTRLISLDFKDAPLREVLDYFKKEAGLAIHARSAGDRKVTVKIANAMPLEALDLVCQKAELDFLPPPGRSSLEPNTAAPPGTIGLYPSLARIPRAFAGPFVVSVPSISLSREAPPGSGMQISMSVYWSPGFQPSRLLDFNFTVAQDDKGNDLRMPMCFIDGRWESFAGALARPLDGRLLDPAPEAQKLSLKGRGALIFTLGQNVLSFKSPGDCVGQERATDQITVRLENCTLGSGAAGFRVKVTKKRDPGTPNGIDAMHFNPNNIRLVTADGQKHRNDSWSASDLVAGGMTVDLKWKKLKSDVTALEFVFDSEVHRAEFEFELKDIPLPK